MFRRALLLLASLAVIAAAAGCGSDASGTASTSAPVPTTANSTSRPSQSALMICGDEGKTQIAATLGVQPTKPVVGQWSQPVYSCTYTYADGSMRLSARELPDPSAAQRYFKTVGAKLGATKSETTLGQGSAQAPNGAFVVVKDAKVLEVDVANLPATFGKPPLARADVGLSVAVVIMGCWTGA